MRTGTLLSAASVLAFSIALSGTAAGQTLDDNQLNVGALFGQANGNANDRSRADNDFIDADVTLTDNNAGFGNASGGSTADNDGIDNKGGTIDNDGYDIDVKDVTVKASNVEDSNNSNALYWWYNSLNTVNVDHSIHDNIAMLSRTDLEAMVSGVNMFNLNAHGAATGGAGLAYAGGEANAKAKGKVKAKADGDSTARNKNRTDADSGGFALGAAGGNTGGDATNTAGSSTAHGGGALNATDGTAAGIFIGFAANKTESTDGSGDAAGASGAGGTAAGDAGDVGDTLGLAVVDADATSGAAKADAKSGNIGNMAAAGNTSSADASNNSAATIEGGTQTTTLDVNFATGSISSMISDLRGINPIVQNTGFASNQNVSISVNAMVASVNGGGTIGSGR